MQALLWKCDLFHITDWQWWCNVLWLHFGLGPGPAGSEPICQASPTVFALKLQFYFDQQLNVERSIFFTNKRLLYIEICAYFIFSFEFKGETRLTYNCAHLRLTKESLTFENDIWWYWVSRRGSTCWYFVVLDQYNLVLLVFKWYWINLGLLCLYILRKKRTFGRMLA